MTCFMFKLEELSFREFEVNNFINNDFGIAYKVTNVKQTEPSIFDCLRPFIISFINRLSVIIDVRIIK